MSDRLSQAAGSAGDPGPSNVNVTPRELLILLVQGLLLGATTAFTVTIISARFLPQIAPPIATGGGMFVGLLCSYTPMRLLARANGSSLTVPKWLLVCLFNAILVMIVVSVI